MKSKRTADSLPASGQNRWKPIMDAAFNGDASLIEEHIKAGADPNALGTTPARYRPLHRAVEHKKTAARTRAHEKAVLALLAHGADPALRGGYDQLTALAAAAIGEIRFVPLLRDRFEPLDIFHACVLGHDQRVSALLRNDSALAKTPDANGWTPLHYATNSNMFTRDPAREKALVRTAELLLQHGASHTATYNYAGGWPIPVLYGCAGRHDFPAMTERLLKAGADPCDGESVYHAADEGHAAALALFEKYVPARKLAKECTACLPVQLHWGHVRGLPWLLAHGADPNALQPRFGNNALHEAALRGASESAVKQLLERGADPHLKNAGGQTAIALAKTPALRSFLKRWRAAPC